MFINIKDFIGSKYNTESKSVPLRVWTSDWPVPKKISLEQYSINTRTSHKTKFNITRLADFCL